MTTLHSTLRARRFVSSSSSWHGFWEAKDVTEDDDDDESNTEGLDDGGGMEDEADGDLDFEDEDEKPREDA